MITSQTSSRRWAPGRGPALVVLAAVLLGSMACGGADATTPATQAADPLTIDIAAVVEQPLDLQVSLPGELTAFQSVAIVARVSGFVKTVAVDRGSRVRGGEVLATLEAPELVARHAEAQSSLRAAEAQVAAAQARTDADRATYDRLKTASATPGVVAGNDVLVAEKAAEASRNLVEAGRQTVEAARQAANAVREMEGYLRVTAPFGGVITERRVHPGALVGPDAPSDAPMMRLVDDTRLRLVVPVPEAYIAGTTSGTAIPFTVAAYPGEIWSGTLARSAHAVDVATRTMAVELDVTNPEGRLSPGTFCQVQWPLHRSAPSLFVPTSSVASTTDRTFVIRVRDGQTEWVTVRTGLTSGRLVEVFGDVKAGDVVAARGTDELRPATPVRTRQPRPAP